MLDRDEAIKNAEEVAKVLKEFNAVVDQVLPIVLPAAEETLAKLMPVYEKLIKELFMGKTFESLAIMGNASYLARALIEKGVSPTDAATQAVQCARLIVELSKT